MVTKTIEQITLSSLNDHSFDQQLTKIVESHAIAVVAVKTNSFIGYVDELWNTLSDSEMARACSSETESVRAKFIIHRGILRLLLAKIASMLPTEIIISHGAYGKPYLKNINLNFNLSHSTNWVFYSLSKDICLGIDVEEDDGSLCIEPLISLFFSNFEMKEFHALDICKRRRAFFQLWTKKEALSKWQGSGLSLDFTQIHFGLETSTSLVRLDNHPPAMVLNISPNQSHHVALAYSTATSENHQLIYRHKKVWLSSPKVNR